MNKTTHADNTFLAACHRHGVKVTPQRQMIFDALQGDTTHPTAKDVYRRVTKTAPHISFDTVNRTLHTFVTMGLLDVVTSKDHVTRFDPHVASHGHFQCIRCNAITDCAAADVSAPQASDVPRGMQGAVIMRRYVVWEGVCAPCAASHPHVCDASSCSSV